MVTTLQDIPTHAAQPQGAQYRYDQLNRIKEMQVWQNMDVINNQWQSGASLSDYRTSYRYDANGNILNLNRNGHNSVNLAMDSLTYHYIAGTNQLAYVDDAVASGNYSVDIDDQAAGNYAYDATGNLIKDVAEEIDSIVWTAYGKVLRVVRSSVSSKPDLHFAYGPDGNRLSKKAVYGNDSTVWTFYVRDAQGNTMATYRHKESSGVLHLTDHVMYGSSRLGSHERRQVELLGAGSSPITARAGIFGLERGDKRYELSNHLGNVLTVVSDRRAKASCADTLVSAYWADVVSTNDYYPFGMGMVERGDDGGYRYGFNGMQRDDEWQGAGNAYDFGARIYDGRLGRWMSVDPLSYEQVDQSPYKSSLNNPLIYVDPDGEKEILTILLQLEDGSRVGIRITRPDRVMTDGPHYLPVTIFDIPLGFDSENRYYDFERTIVLIQASDGLKVIEQHVKILTEGPVRDADLVTFGEAEPEGHIKEYRPWKGLEGSGSEQSSGVNFVTSAGGDSQTKTISLDKFVRTINIDDLMSIMGAMGKNPGNLPDVKSVLGEAEVLSLYGSLKSEVEELNSGGEATNSKLTTINVYYTTSEGNTVTTGSIQTDFEEGKDVKSILKPGMRYKRHDTIKN